MPEKKEEAKTKAFDAREYRPLNLTLDITVHDIQVITKILYKINTCKIFSKRSKKIWGNFIPNFIIWVSYQRDEGA